MRNMMRKEMRLSASVLSYLFILFGLMFLLPGYPILCGVFFVTLGIFQSFQRCAEFIISRLHIMIYGKTGSVFHTHGILAGNGIIDSFNFSVAFISAQPVNAYSVGNNDIGFCKKIHAFFNTKTPCALRQRSYFFKITVLK